MQYKLKLYNTLHNKLEDFIPINKDYVGMYVCGPTVYDRAHIGNARPAVVFDVLYRVLKYLYNNVKYVRNITDVDDKIYKAAKNKHISINDLTQETAKMYHDDTDALNVLSVDIEPKATEHINDIIEFIQRIIDSGSGYISNNHVYFDVTSYSNYGELSNKTLDDLINGSRIEVSQNKKNPGDFVLWKPVDDEFPVGWDSPWGKGRPGWHIECSTMANKYLGDKFDIHGGGCDLVFPHHENEIAQSYSANKKIMANYWIHNGHVMIDCQKMSKSLGNVCTVRSILDKFNGETIRLALLMTHYRSPLNFCSELLQQSKNILDKWYQVIMHNEITNTDEVDENMLSSLLDDLNTPQAIHNISSAMKNNNNINTAVNTCRKFLGILNKNPNEWFHEINVDEEWILKQIELRKQAKQNKDYVEADRIRNVLCENGIVLEDSKNGTSWKRK
ncbi:MAG: cysteine--tRNA ligase [Alphaproteobacteria bacterium]|nr:cysteine--tRNA ligase [Alphaproteobacteria bacterium]